MKKLGLSSEEIEAMVSQELKIEYLSLGDLRDATIKAITKAISKNNEKICNQIMNLLK